MGDIQLWGDALFWYPSEILNNEIGMSNYDTSEQVKQGFRMNTPPNMPPDISRIMEACWKESTDERPEFSDIHRILRGETVRMTRYIRKPFVNSLSASEQVEEESAYVIASPEDYSRVQNSYHTKYGNEFYK